MKNDDEHHNDEALERAVEQARYERAIEQSLREHGYDPEDTESVPFEDSLSILKRARELLSEEPSLEDIIADLKARTGDGPDEPPEVLDLHRKNYVVEVTFQMVVDVPQHADTTDVHRLVDWVLDEQLNGMAHLSDDTHMTTTYLGGEEDFGPLEVEVIATEEYDQTDVEWLILSSMSEEE